MKVRMIGLKMEHRNERENYMSENKKNNEREIDTTDDTEMRIS